MVMTVIAANMAYFVYNVELSPYFSEVHNSLQSIHSFREIGSISLIVCSVSYMKATAQCHRKFKLYDIHCFTLRPNDVGKRQPSGCNSHCHLVLILRDINRVDLRTNTRHRGKGEHVVPMWHER